MSNHNCYTSGITAYSVQSDWDNSLKREPLFLTKRGNLIDSISVMWDDPHGDREDYFYGVELDNPVDTKEVYIQVIEAETGTAMNKSIVYRWDGKHFVYSGIRHDFKKKTMPCKALATIQIAVVKSAWKIRPSRTIIPGGPRSVRCLLSTAKSGLSCS